MAGYKYFFTNTGARVKEATILHADYKCLLALFAVNPAGMALMSVAVQISSKNAVRLPYRRHSAAAIQDV